MNSSSSVYDCDDHDGCRRYSDAVVCGFISRDGSVRLNPDEQARPGPGSRLILLSHVGECWRRVLYIQL
jgi:hypothetical protein